MTRSRSMRVLPATSSSPSTIPIAIVAVPRMWSAWVSGALRYGLVGVPVGGMSSMRSNSVCESDSAQASTHCSRNVASPISSSSGRLAAHALAQGLHPGRLDLDGGHRSIPSFRPVSGRGPIT